MKKTRVSWTTKSKEFYLRKNDPRRESLKENGLTVKVILEVSGNNASDADYKKDLSKISKIIADALYNAHVPISSSPKNLRKNFGFWIKESYPD